MECFLFLSCHSSVFIENVAVLPSLLELLNAAVRIEEKGRTGPFHAPTNPELGAEILES